MNREVLMLHLRQSFPDSEHDARRLVARQAGDLADAGQYSADKGRALSPQAIVEGLTDAPEDDLVSRWNWWIGALDAAYDGYARFRIRRFSGEG